MGFVHLNVHSYYSFLDGASSPKNLIATGAKTGMKAMALTDKNGLYGVVEFIKEAKILGIKPIIGAEVDILPIHPQPFRKRYPITLLARGPQGYSNLCRLISHAHLANPRGEPVADLVTLAQYSKDIYALSGGRDSEVGDRLLHGDWDGAQLIAEKLRNIFGTKRLFLEVVRDLTPGSYPLSLNLIKLSHSLNLRVVATNAVRFATREGFHIHDVLTCIGQSINLATAHPSRPFNRERYLKSYAEMRVLFRDYPAALRNSLVIAEECELPLDLDTKHYPLFPLSPKETAEGVLRQLAYQGASQRYGKITSAIQSRLEHELSIINNLGFAHYFLIVWDIANYARQRNILFAGRGSAADSAVAYCLGITEVDSISRGLLFERFISPERAEMPDIDLDFDARYRDEVANYLINRYGRNHVASVCTYHTFRARSAIRDVGKALDIPDHIIDALARNTPWHLPADAINQAIDLYPELKAFVKYNDTPNLQLLFELCASIAGFPRHLGTHLGGLVITDSPINSLSPLQRTAKGDIVIQFDKNFAESLGLVKIDLLPLRTLSAIKDTGHKLETIPLQDPETYRLIRNAETIGVFQLESPAQRSLQARLGASNIEDIIASVALIRPGPIKGNMVTPYIKRRQGVEPVRYPHPKLEPILSKTLGVVLFQEQVIDIARAIAGFTPGEADQLRRVMSHARSQKAMDEIGEAFVRKAVANGIDPSTAKEIFAMIAGYASYGFCEAHAAAFAVTSIRTAYLACHHPAKWFASMLTHQPMGYYPRQTLVTEARKRGVTILPPDINKSKQEFTIEEGQTIRVGLRAIKGMSERGLERIFTARKKGPFSDFRDFFQRTRLTLTENRSLILAGAFDSLEPNRRLLLLNLLPMTTPNNGIPLFETAPVSNRRYSPDSDKDKVDAPDFTPSERVYHELSTMGFSLTSHPVGIWRGFLTTRGFTDSKSLQNFPPGKRVLLAGLPIRPHRPPTRSGRVVAFLSLEDEYGLADVTVFEGLYRKKGRYLFGETPVLLGVKGKVEWQGTKPQIVAEDIFVPIPAPYWDQF